MWMVANLLKVNDDKTVALVIAPRNNQAKQNITVIKIGDRGIPPSPTARNFGAVFDSGIVYNYESLFVEVETEKNKIVIDVIYKPPDTCIHTFNIHFNDLLGRISNKIKKCI